MAGGRDFDVEARRQRSSLGSSTRDDRLLIRCGTLAASSHNTQPWRFDVEGDTLLIRPDRARRCPVVDPDDAHLFRSLGCAAENVVQAAAAQGLVAEVRFDAERDAVLIHLAPSAAARATDLFEAIGQRQCTRLPFDGTPCSPDELDALEEAGAGADARVAMVTDPELVASIAALVAKGNDAQLTDRSFRRELLSWIRFNPTEALRSGDGLAGRCTGNPALPRPLGRLLAPFVIRARSQSARDLAGIQSSAGLAIFVSAGEDEPAWIDVGRSYQRFALRATVLGVCTAFINQPVEVPGLRTRLASLLGLEGEHPHLAVRFGHGDAAPFSLRRPIDDVIDLELPSPSAGRERGRTRG